MQSMAICYFLFFMLVYIFFTIFQYGEYGSHKKILKSIFELELKLYEDDIPILICFNNEIFIKHFFLVFRRVLILLLMYFSGVQVLESSIMVLIQLL